jgi:hypothetical protein
MGIFSDWNFLPLLFLVIVCVCFLVHYSKDRR